MTTPPMIPRLLRALRLLPHALPGKARVVRWILNHFLNDGPAVIPVGDLLYRVPSTREPVAIGLIADAGYEHNLCSELARQLHSNSTFFDIGANVGFMTLSAAHYWCPQGRIVGFEASPRIYSFLQGNVQQNPHEGLVVMNRAVTSSSGEHISFYDAPVEKFGMGSMTNRFATSAVDVVSISLDDAAIELQIDSADVIKVDVEGFELGVFQGAQNLLKQTPAPFIIFEFNDWAEANERSQPGDAQRFLRGMGYATMSLKSWQKGRRSHEPIIVKGSADIVAFRE